MQAVDLLELTAAVRRERQSLDFEILDWNARDLTHHGGGSSDALFHYSGHGRDSSGVRPWSIVLKVLKPPESSAARDDWWYWKRDLLVYESRLLNHLPGSMAAPRCYGTADAGGEFHIWLEHINENVTGPWGLDQYAFAARQAGRFHGAYVTGTPLPDHAWLSKGALASWLTVWNPERGWDSPYVTRYITPATRDQIMQVWNARERYFAMLDCLPQTFSHLDFHRRNLMIRNRAGGAAELVAIDWERCGIAPLGADLALLVGVSCLFFEWEPSEAPALERAALDGYMAGLRASGWQGDERLARLGYLAWIGLWLGVIMSSAIDAFTRDDARAFATQLIRRDSDALAAGWATLGAFALSRAGQAQDLMTTLKVA